MKICLAFASAILLATGSLSAQAPTGQQLAEHLDKTRRPPRSFEVHLAITELRDGKPIRTSNHHLFARKEKERPDFDAVTLVLSPEEERDKVVLTKGNEVWLYDPKSRRPVSIPARKFRGKFFVADALSTSFAAQYDSEYVGEEKVLDAARKERLCHHVRMKQRDKSGSTPEVIEYWVEKGSMRVVRGQFFQRGKLIRTAFYTGYQKVLDEMRPMRILVINASEPGIITDIVFNKLAYRDTPESLYTPEALPAVSRRELP
jgi:outer membrane lipoprotein-sorting protein